MASFVAFGHSHIVALAKGASLLQQQGAAIAGHFHYLHDKAFEPLLTQTASGAALHPEILAKLAEGDPQWVLLCVGGNEHNTLSIVQTAQRYDFILGENPALALEAGAEIYPEAMIRETLREAMTDHFNLLKALRVATAKPIAQFEPPPPLPTDHVLAYPNELFRDVVDKRNLSSDCLRYKVWRVQSGLYREYCAKIGVHYIPAPPEMFGRDGMLAEAARGRDATHANDWFGRRMFEEMLKRFSSDVIAGSREANA